MKTNAITLFGKIAVSTQQLESIFRKIILTKPVIKRTATRNKTTMFSTVIIDMINGQNFRPCLTTAYALVPISIQYFITKLGIPDSSILSCIRLSKIRFVTDILEPVAIMAKKLEFMLRETIIAEPCIETMPTTSISTTMITTIIIDMINRKKCRVSSTALDACATISSENLLTKQFSRSLPGVAMFSYPLHFSIMAFLTKMGSLSKKNTASLAHAYSSSLLVTARPTRKAKFILASSIHLMKVFGSNRKPLLTVNTKFLLLRRNRINVKNNIINRLITQCIKIKRALNNVFGYTIMHDGSFLSAIMPRDVCCIAEAALCCIPLLCHRSASLPADMHEGTIHLAGVPL